MDTKSLQNNLQRLCEIIARPSFVAFYRAFLWAGLFCAIAFTLLYAGFFVYGIWRGNAWAACEIYFSLPWLAPAFIRYLPLKYLLGYAFCGYAISFIIIGAKKELQLSSLAKLCSIFSLPVILTIFLASWGASLYDPQPHVHSALGIIPYSDANGHFTQPLSYLLNGIMPNWVLRRPMAALLGAAFSALGDGLPPIVYFLRCCLAATSLWALVWSVEKTFGIWAALVSIAYMWYFAFPYLPVYSSEIFGFIWGCLAVALWLEAMRRNSLAFGLAALGATAIALMIRMGSMFLIPFFTLFVFFKWGKGKKLTVGILLSVILCSIFLVNKALLYLGDGNQDIGSNFSYSLAGMTLGGNWGASKIKYAEEIKGLPEGQVAPILYKKALENIRANPEIFIGRLWEGEKEFWKNLISWFLPWHKPLVLIGLLLIFHFFYLPVTQRIFWLIFWLGVACSIPFIYFDEGWRVNFVAYPFMSVFLGLALTMPEHHREGTAKDCKALFLAAAIICLMVLTAICPNIFRVSHLPEMREFLHSAPPLASNQFYAIGGGKNIGVIVGDGDCPPLKIPLNRFNKLAKAGDAYLGDASKLEYFPRPPFAVMSQPIPGGGRPMIGPPEMIGNKNVLIWKITTEKLGDADWYKVIECEPVLTIAD